MGLSKTLTISLFVSILAIACISAQSCIITERASCVGNDNIVLGLSSSTNAHGELANQGNYDYVLCCDFGTGDTTCTGANKILGLEFATNAHAEISANSNYGTNVCFSDLSCASNSGGCPSGYNLEMLSLSSTTNAHLGGFDDYNTKICCELNITPPICGNNIKETGEECDDGNLINHDNCSSVCEDECYDNSWCTDGILFADYEECDDGNKINGDGCSSVCKLEKIYPPCPEGLSLCSDGTCSLNCDSTDCDYDGICDNNEGCACIDCEGEQDSCASGLLCSLEDTGCCNKIIDGVCNNYCFFSDPDCGDASCGNNIKETGEECDDGNKINGDGCSSTCTNEKQKRKSGGGSGGIIETLEFGKPAETAKIQIINLGDEITGLTEKAPENIARVFFWSLGGLIILLIIVLIAVAVRR